MRSWLFRRRHVLRTLYGLPPEARLLPLLEAARTEPGEPSLFPEPGDATAPAPGAARAASGRTASRRAGWLWPRRRAE